MKTRGKNRRRKRVCELALLCSEPFDLNLGHPGAASFGEGDGNQVIVGRLHNRRAYSRVGVFFAGS